MKVIDIKKENIRPQDVVFDEGANCTGNTVLTTGNMIMGKTMKEVLWNLHSAGNTAMVTKGLERDRVCAQIYNKFNNAILHQLKASKKKFDPRFIVYDKKDKTYKAMMKLYLIMPWIRRRLNTTCQGYLRSINRGANDKS
jgi:hypothetical protein